MTTHSKTIKERSQPNEAFEVQTSHSKTARERSQPSTAFEVYITSHRKTIRERSQPSAPKRSKNRPRQHHHSAAPTISSAPSSWAWAEPAAAAATRTRGSSAPSRCWWPNRACRRWRWASRRRRSMTSCTASSGHSRARRLAAFCEAAAAGFNRGC